MLAPGLTPFSPPVSAAEHTNPKTGDEETTAPTVELEINQTLAQVEAPRAVIRN